MKRPWRRGPCQRNHPMGFGAGGLEAHRTAGICSPHTHCPPRPPRTCALDGRGGQQEPARHLQLHLDERVTDQLLAAAATGRLLCGATVRSQGRRLVFPARSHATCGGGHYLRQPPPCKQAAPATHAYAHTAAPRSELRWAATCQRTTFVMVASNRSLAASTALEPRSCRAGVQTGREHEEPGSRSGGQWAGAGSVPASPTTGACPRSGSPAQAAPVPRPHAAHLGGKEAHGGAPLLHRDRHSDNRLHLREGPQTLTI